MTASQCLEEKSSYARKTLSAWQSRMAAPQTAPEIRQWGYRDKVCLAAAWQDDAWHIGLMGRDTVLSIHRCPIQGPLVRHALSLLIEILPPGDSFPLAFYAQSGTQVTLVVKSARMPDMAWLDSSAQNRVSEAGIEGLWLCLHPSAGHRVFARSGWRLVWGKPRSMDARGLAYGPTTFGQPIVELAEKALATAEDFLQPSSGDLVVDLYCGIGAGLTRWTKRNAHVIGVELSKESVECARQNAPDATVLRGACRHRIPQLTMILENDYARRLVYANPPRAGLERETADWVATTCRPDRVAYLSCNAAALKRDLARLETAGYKTEHILPFDFFPHTRHLEVLALLSRR